MYEHNVTDKDDNYTIFGCVQYYFILSYKPTIIILLCIASILIISTIVGGIILGIVTISYKSEYDLNTGCPLRGACENNNLKLRCYNNNGFSVCFGWGCFIVLSLILLGFPLIAICNGLFKDYIKQKPPVQVKEILVGDTKEKEFLLEEIIHND